ncbi:hypothetical protein F5X96DRAFT_673926 [Biscogniauxia mediterranea]|nr:hypothetical protein F5X96DRAFT_673926 [Biscogniauxia mediterranea]
MPKKEVFELRPVGWESDPLDEYFKLSALDYYAPQWFCAFSLFFKLTDEEKPKIIPVLKRGLEVTLSQCRHLNGYLEKHPEGGLCFHKKRESTVEFHVQWLDGPESEGEYPSFYDLEKRHFVSQALGEIYTWCVPPMALGEKPEAKAARNPKGAAYKASFIRGGLVFVMHFHHYANDAVGWKGELNQLAKNCFAIWKCPENPSFPSWDPACLDRSRITPPDVPEDQQVDGPVCASKHPDMRSCQRLLFHVPKSKKAELKRLASLEDRSYQISSYDAYVSYMWRILTKHKAKLYKPDPKQHLRFQEWIDVRMCFHDPPVPASMQGNGIYLASNANAPVPPLTAEEVISQAPLEKLAWYVRQITNSVTQERVVEEIAATARIRNKAALDWRADSPSPLTVSMTDWRGTRPADADFGFAKPHGFRLLWDAPTPNVTGVYLERAHNPPAGEDEGNEISMTLEKEIIKDVLEDPEWNGYFEFRGLEADDKPLARRRRQYVL